MTSTVKDLVAGSGIDSPTAACSAQGCARDLAALFGGRDVKRYLTSVSILNIGMYIAMIMTPTMRPTPIIMIGSTIDVSDYTAASTSSS